MIIIIPMQVIKYGFGSLKCRQGDDKYEHGLLLALGYIIGYAPNKRSVRTISLCCMQGFCTGLWVRD